MNRKEKWYKQSKNAQHLLSSFTPIIQNRMYIDTDSNSMSILQSPLSLIKLKKEK